jgi:hypothetical protein
MPAATRRIATATRVTVFVVVPSGASGAKGRIERQASNSGRLYMMNLGIGRLTRQPCFFGILMNH